MVWGAVALGAFVSVAMLVLPILAGLMLVATEEAQEPGGTCQARTVSGEGGVELEVPNGWGPAVEDAAKVAGVPAAVLAAQLEAESGWDPTVVSPAGAAGLAQFMPGTWEQYGQGDPMDPLASIAAQGRYMKALMALAEPHADDADERVQMALAAYNWGPGNMDAVGWDWEQGPAETLAYVPSILGGAQLSFSTDCAPVTGQYVGDLGDGEWAQPLPGGTMTGGGAFGLRNVPGLPAWAQNHVGIDLATPDGSGQVVAPFPFRVTAVYDPDGCVLGKGTTEPEFGIAVCHMDDWNAEVGMEYERGEVVGSEGSRAGSVGAAVIPHLHLELYRPEGGDPTSPGPGNPDIIDPTPILRAKGAL